MSSRIIPIDGGLITAEKISQPCWLLRRRINGDSLTSPYVWVATVAEPLPGRCEVKGYLARKGFSMIPSEYKTVQTFIEELGFAFGEYQRMDAEGNARIAHEITKSGRIAQKTD